MGPFPARSMPARTDEDCLRALSAQIRGLTESRNAAAEDRRKLARRLAAQGWSIARIANAAGVTKGTAQGWI
jgi:hypothetical protein